MAKKFLDYEGLGYFSTKIKTLIAGKADATHASTHKTGGSDPLGPADIGADPAAFLVTFAGTASNGFTSDKTLSEIRTAYNAGQRVHAKDSEGRVYNLVVISSMYAQFTSVKASAITSVLVIYDGSIDVATVPVETQMVSITFSTSWTEGDNYTQTVTVSGGNENSLVALQPTAAQIVALQEAGVTALMVDNDNGTFTATAVGAAPAEAMTIQATLTEVSA